MGTTYFENDFRPDGVILRLLEKSLLSSPRPVPVSSWPERTGDASFSGVARMLTLLDEADSPVEESNGGLFVDHRTIAGLTEPQALGIGLPPSVRFGLQIETKNLITDRDFRITARWIGLANQPLHGSRKGAFVEINESVYRVPEPFFSILEETEKFAAVASLTDDIRIAHISRIQAMLPVGVWENISLDPYFSSFRILHAAAFSLSLRIEGQNFDFEPVLFGRRVVERAKAESVSVDEAEALLTEHQQDVFANRRFRSSERVSSSYVIERGVYVHLDSSLREALTVVKRMQQADPQTRKRFAQSPQRYLKEALADALSDEDVERLFIETEQYSARVIDIGIWSPPVLPWMKRDPNDWLPEKFGLQIEDQYVVIEGDELSPLREQIRVARAEGAAFVEFGTEKTRIPASAATEEALSNLFGIVQPSGKPEAQPASATRADAIGAARPVLIVEENFDKSGFTRKIMPRGAVEVRLPSALRASLKPHQRSGITWLQETWFGGYPGVLLADDMGLGKTLQALSFLAWLREVKSVRKGSDLKCPILIVAPTGLLPNWESEHNLHLHDPGLGNICRAYGRHLRSLKSEATSHRAEEVLSLDRRRIQQADWVLTTYETLRDHHISFASIPFISVVFDEMQKVKSPTSLLTRAAKTLNADYIIGLTGTPIENHLADLWCIMDIISPGLLGDLKGFIGKYRAEDEKALEELHTSMLMPRTTGPAPMLRRMKADELDGLPKKTVHVRPRPMPEVQASVYSKVVARAKQAEAGPMLETLHLLRGVSLHPVWPPASEIEDTQAFIAQSARLTETFVILDDIAKKREKVLIFIESLELQEHLALLIKKRYGLRRLPMRINGEIAGEKRQELVDQFQSERGVFDAMILSPRAGGVGLTLTAANHVIHLSRWWNPAVEDQCTDRVYRIGQNQTVHVYYPMAVHPGFGESSFDQLLNALLDRKRKLAERMFLPPVNLKRDQSWFAENLGQESFRDRVPPVDIEEIDCMEPTTFERWVLGRCISVGWEASRTPGSYDGGADGVLIHPVSKAIAIVQCKHKRDAGDVCGPAAIDDLLRARTNYHSSARLFVLTNAKRFARTTEERAERYGISLVGRGDLHEWPRQLMY
jgi:hypothetical protein